MLSKKEQNELLLNFDWKFYTSYYKELNVLKTEKMAKNHFIKYGFKEGRICYKDIKNLTHVVPEETLDKHNIFYDMVYIINLKKNKFKKEKSIFQLKKNKFTNFKFMDAVNGKSRYYSKLYDIITKKMSKDYIKHNFQIGALGCFLSHINCILDAKKNKYKQILILEDDFIVTDNYNEKIINLFNEINLDWDFIYLGKKQWDNNYNPNNITDIVYKPDHNTFATHSLLIKETIFDAIIKLANNIDSPIDISLQKLYNEFKFWTIHKDLFITDDNYSDIQQKNYYDWKWDHKVYSNPKIIYIKNIIIYGFKKSYHHTHSYIHSMYYNSFKYYYPMLNIYFLDEDEINIIDKSIFDDSIIFCSPTHYKYSKYIYGKNTYYIFHLDNYINVGYKSIDHFLNDNIVKDLLKNINNYTILLCRKDNNINYLEENIEEKQICLPWFSDKNYNDLLYVKNNLNVYYNNIKEKKYLAYFGSIWDKNIDIIIKLIEICKKKNIYLLLKGRIFDITNNEKNIILEKNEYIQFVKFDYDDNNKNSFDYLKEKYSIKCLLSLQGSEHNNTYISNRIFEAVSNGHIGITNNKITKEYYNSSIYNSDIDKLIDEVQEILCDEKKWCDILSNQLNEFIEKFYSYNNITSCLNLLKKVSVNNNEIIILENEKNKNTYKLWFCSTNYYSDYFYTIKTNIDIIEKLKNKQDLIINLNNYENLDIFLIRQLILNHNYDVYIDQDFTYSDYIKNICDKNDIHYNLKNNLNINCLVSGQRCGSTLIIDILQKLSKNTLALSEVLSEVLYKEAYYKSYDIKNKYGVLYDFNLNTCDENIDNYLKQFIDYAIYKNKKLFMFKITIDFNKPLKDTDKLEEIINYISQFKIIYLSRNVKPIYISKKLADKNGYSNTLYEYPE
jgi:glycosyl transferase family 25